MKSTVDQAPRFSSGDAMRLAAELFGIEATADPLPSERDQNFRMITADGARHVLKIANGLEPRDVLEFQNAVLGHLALRIGSFGSLFPRLIETRDRETIASAAGPDGTAHMVRMLTWVPGEPLARVRPHRAGLLRNLGCYFGRLDRALDDFDHPGAHRDFLWDLRNATRVAADYGPDIEDAALRAVVRRLVERFEKHTLAGLDDLRKRVIHNDGNDYNVLVEPRPCRPNRVSGVVDFGDMVHTYLVGEVAIAAAYAVLGKVDPLAAAAHVIAGYHDAHPLSEQEIEAAVPLVCMRLVMSVCIAAHQHKRAPDNEYLTISQRPATEALHRLDRIHPRLAHYTIRQACGMTPSVSSPAVTSWIDRAGADARPVVDADLAGPDVIVLDLSVGSDDPAAEATSAEAVGRSYSVEDAPIWTAAIFGKMREEGARVAIGRYDEPRRIYTTEQFDIESDELPERRTVHLGIDLFMEAGTPVHAPLAGKVYSVALNGDELDYGPTVILEHRAGPDGPGFYTLYGHLGLDLPRELEPGWPVEAGETVGTIGPYPVNGGWPPHLHFQLICDMLDETGNFPGVAAPGQRELWRSLCPDPGHLLGIPSDRGTKHERPREEILAVRDRHLGPSLSLSYDEPLKIVRGQMQFLYDDVGHPYLDGVNNVCHVGHGHPRVVAAGQRQMAVLNTNTRYLHGTLATYVERLLETLPEPLQVCYLVCSGSEANELALRLARTHTARRGIVTVDGAYHGNTQGLVEISPYKSDGPGGAGLPDHVCRVPMPDPYRGLHRGISAACGPRYAEYLDTAIAQLDDRGHAVAAFICESLLGCGGQIVLPAGFLREAWRRVREAGGVCIADEIQVGFGRVGTHFWGFETQGVVPDIVTLGKPIGNGHPLAAVITTREIAESFDNGMEYFNTFGGNPVSCAIGLAVLDVIRDERLQRHALEVGERLAGGLRDLMQRHPLIGDVRGAGLFLGVELVLDRGTLEPAPRQAAYVVERLKDHGILLSTDGPLRNVLKIKPPLPFDAADADRLIETLDRILGETPLGLT
jgi:4-aminobutyrate aminotransferase-like enzyme/Ser/Thr protein kinase RdoA (MazF antagonist)